MSTIIQERLQRLLLPSVHLRNGKGGGANGTIDVCAVQASDWLAGGDGTNDQPSCVSKKIGAYVIGLNDSPLFREHLDLLKPYCAKLVGTAGESGEREVKRAYLLADYAVRVFAPIWLRADPQQRFEKYAKACEECAPITDEPSREAARYAASAARYAASAARYAASAASAASATYATASAASAAYAASAADAAYAESAASAASAESAADAARTKVLAVKGDELRAAALRCLDDLLAV